jgi:cellulose biosynthesis protein BcsQ
MDFLNELGNQYEGFFTLATSVFGVAGFVFGIWRYLIERKIRRSLEEKQAELDKALSRLKHLDDVAAGCDVNIWTSIPAHVMASPAIPVLSVGNLKGGVGKTTVVANLATALAQSGIRVLAIDLDFQASLSVALPPHIMPRYEVSDGAINVLKGSDYDMFHDSHVTAQGVAPFADLSLVRTSLELADVEDSLFAAFVLGKYDTDPRFALARKLTDPRLKRDFDLVIIDTPPRLTMASINALCASTHVLIPTALTPMSESGAVTFSQYLKEFQDTLCPKLQVLAVLPTLTRGILNDAEKKTLQNLERALPVWHDLHIPQRQAIADNNVLKHRESREIFKALAEKVTETLRLHPDGTHEGHRAYRSAQFGGTRLPQ